VERSILSCWTIHKWICLTTRRSQFCFFSNVTYKLMNWKNASGASSAKISGAKIGG